MARRAIARVLSVGMLVAGSVACNSLLGANDYTIAEGATGSAGSGGGAACTAPATDPDLVRACIVQAGCSIYAPPFSLSVCIAFDSLGSYPANACTARAKTCDDVAVCEGSAFLPGLCAAGESGWKCVGSKAISCGQTPYMIDCATKGGTCDVSATANTKTLPCRVQETCTGTATACVGDVLSTCVGGKGYGLNCAVVKGKCQTTATGPACVYALPTCSPAGHQVCEGSKARVCFNDNLEVTFTCSSGLSCLVTDNDTPNASSHCLAPGCTPEQDNACQESCDGTNINLCYGGAQVTFDCASYGFKSCRTFKDDRLGSYAKCTVN